ncbi:MAG TPA: hypothetical protein VNA20_15195 [Frankiaceae bacterium]|nr:hypothetical protein [Frankiaceae bacterium]
MTKRLTLRAEHLTELTASDLAAVVGGTALNCDWNPYTVLLCGGTPRTCAVPVPSAVAGLLPQTH